MEMMVSTEVSGLWQDDRCSSNSDPGDVYYFGNWYLVHEYWNGLKMHIPGQSAQTVLDNPQSPKKHPTNTRKTTNQYWDVACFIVSGASEGFIATAPDGTKYTFGKLRYLAASGILKDFKVMGRNRAQMLVTKVEDRFGNVVNYTYTGSNLTSISSNDGRTISISYGANSKVSSVTANGRTWTYGDTTYTGYNYDFLTSVTWPNGQAWSFDLHELVMAEQSDGLKLICWWARKQQDRHRDAPVWRQGYLYAHRDGARPHRRAEARDHQSRRRLRAEATAQTTLVRRAVADAKETRGARPAVDDLELRTYSQNQGGWLNDGTNPIKTTRSTIPDGTYKTSITSTVPGLTGRARLEKSRFLSTPAERCCKNGAGLRSRAQPRRPGRAFLENLADDDADQRNQTKVT